MTGSIKIGNDPVISLAVDNLYIAVGIPSSKAN
jgi:hypothetical protein